MSGGCWMQPHNHLPSWQCPVQPSSPQAAQPQPGTGSTLGSCSPDAAAPHHWGHHPRRDQQRRSSSKPASLACWGPHQQAKCAKPLSVSRHLLCCSEALSTCDSGCSAASGLLDTTGASLSGARGGALGTNSPLQPHQPSPADCGASWYECVQWTWAGQQGAACAVYASQEGLCWGSQHSEQALALPHDSDMDWSACTSACDDQQGLQLQQLPCQPCAPCGGPAKAAPLGSSGSVRCAPTTALARNPSCVSECAASTLPAQLLLLPQGLGGASEADDNAVVPSIPIPARGASPPSASGRAAAAASAAADAAACVVADPMAGRKRVRDSPGPSGPAAAGGAQRSAKKLLCVVHSSSMDAAAASAGGEGEQRDAASSAPASAAAAAASPEGSPGEEAELAAGISKLLCPLEPRYIIGTSLPIQGWFQFCRGCGIKTARTHDILGHDVPLCHDCRTKYDAMVAGTLPCATPCSVDEEPLSKWIPGVVAPGTRRLTGEQRATICSAIILRQDQAWQRLVAASW